jgi:hypothetical protein
LKLDHRRETVWPQKWRRGSNGRQLTECDCVVERDRFFSYALPP